MEESSAVKTTNKIQIYFIVFAICLIVALIVIAFLIDKKVLFTDKKEYTDLHKNTIALYEITPQPSGNPFKTLVLDEQSGLARTTIVGRIIDVADSKDKKGKLFALQRSDGIVVRDLLFVKNDFRPILVTLENGVGKETRVPITTLKKDDQVMVTYNRNTKTDEGFVADIRINR